MLRRLVDGNTIVAEVASEFIDIAGVYPITPSTSMAETVENISHKKKNFFGKDVIVQEMQSEAGAIACCHGALLAGKYAATFTSSQGLLLMIPEMYKIAGEMLPMVMHVAARSLSTHALSIYNDHQDVMAVRQTGFYMICSSSAQECYWNAIKAHVMAIKYNIPVLHFFDGFYTSHRLETIEVLDDNEFKDLINNILTEDDYQDFSLCGILKYPQIIGTNQKDEYADNTRRRVNWYDQYSDIFGEVTREYFDNYETEGPFEIIGNILAKKYFVAIGSVCETIKELIKDKNDIALLKINQFRPVSNWMNLLKGDKIDSSVEFHVIEKTIEPGADSPLALDIMSQLQKHGKTCKVFTHNIGLSSENISIDMLKEIVGLSIDKEKEPYAIRINGKGSEGLVTSTKWVAEVLFKQGYYVQALSTYSAYKSSGDTWSELRVSRNKIGLQCEVIKPSKEYRSEDFRPDLAEKYNIPGKLSAIAAYMIINQYWAWLGFNHQKAVSDLKDIITNKFNPEIAEKNIKMIDEFMDEMRDVNEAYFG